MIRLVSYQPKRSWMNQSCRAQSVFIRRRGFDSNAVVVQEDVNVEVFKRTEWDKSESEPLR